MAKKASIEPQSLYRVELAKAARIGRGAPLLPGAGTVLRGDVLASLLERDPEAVSQFDLVGQS